MSLQSGGLSGIGRFGSAADQPVSSKSLTARYRSERLRQVLRFIHGELALQEGVDVYNIHYPSSVASARVSDGVDEVMERIGPDVQRFVLPLFRGRNRTIRVEHADLKMVAEFPDFGSLEDLRDRWTAAVGTEGTLSYGLRASGRAARSAQVTRLIHLVVQVATLYTEERPLDVVVECSGGRGSRQDAVVSTVEVPHGALMCSDCTGYHAPGVAQRLQSRVAALAFGTLTMRVPRDDDLFTETLVVPTSSFTIEYESRSLAKVRDVDNLLTRMLTGGGE